MIFPIAGPFSLNHKFMSGPTVRPKGVFATLVTANSVMAPESVAFATFAACVSVNQTSPSGPDAMDPGPEPFVGSEKYVNDALAVGDGDGDADDVGLAVGAGFVAGTVAEPPLPPPHAASNDVNATASDDAKRNPRDRVAFMRVFSVVNKHDMMRAKLRNFEEAPESPTVHRAILQIFSATSDTSLQRSQCEIQGDYRENFARGQRACNSRCNIVVRVRRRRKFDARDTGVGSWRSRRTNHRPIRFTDDDAGGDTNACPDHYDRGLFRAAHF